MVKTTKETKETKKIKTVKESNATYKRKRKSSKKYLPVNKSVKVYTDEEWSKIMNPPI